MWRAAYSALRTLHSVLCTRYSVLCTPYFPAAILAPLSRHLSATDGTPGIGLLVATRYGQLETVLEPLLDQLGQAVKLPVGAEEVLGTDAQQREPETTRQLILLGVSLGVRPWPACARPRSAPTPRRNRAAQRAATRTVRLGSRAFSFSAFCSCDAQFPGLSRAAGPVGCTGLQSLVAKSALFLFTGHNAAPAASPGSRVGDSARGERAA